MTSVQSENLWQSAGVMLIEAVKAAAKAKGATQILAVCGAHDYSKTQVFERTKSINCI